MPSAAYKEYVSFEPEYRSIATLADESAGLTCSVNSGQAWAPGRARAIVGYPEFELAAESVRAGEHDLLLVPAAYSHIRNFFFDPSLKAVDIFLHQLPDMVFAIPNSERADRLETVFHHPATEPLVQQLSNNGWRTVHASSNSAACQAVLDHPGPAGAVTNQIAADYYEFDTVRGLSAGTAMGFVVFTRRTRT